MNQNKTKFIGISIVLITILLFSSTAHPINAFRAPIHSDITDESLGFLQSDVLDKISSTNVNVDETNKGSEFHLYSCDFQGATKNINSLYDQLVTNIQDNIDAPGTFGRLLHPVQDFYAHSNWVELGKKDLIDNGDGKWIVLKPFQEYKGVIIVQVEDKNDSPEEYTLSENGKVVDVSSQSGNHPGLISTTFRDNDFCPEDVSLDHDILHKDDSDRPGYDKARELAKAQTIHEWCRLTNLVEQSHGQAGVKLLFNSWVDDKDKAKSVCLSDNGSSLNTDVEDNRYVEENNNKNTVVIGEEPVPPIPPVDECPESEEIEACFEEFLFEGQFPTLVAALESQEGITVEINGEEVTLRSFEDICEALEGLTFEELPTAIEEILVEAGISPPFDFSILICIAEAIDIPIPPE
jgi:hypothetical protein